MSSREILDWLKTYSDEIFNVMDYRPSAESDEDLTDFLNAWFDSSQWQESGHQFKHLGDDPTGSQLALWIRPGEETAQVPVVFFGSEGDRGVITRNLTSWAQLVAHAPEIDTDHNGTIHCAPGFDNFLKDAAELGQNTEHMQDSYDKLRSATIEKFGPLPEFAELRANLNELNAEFVVWVEKQLPEDEDPAD